MGARRRGRGRRFARQVGCVRRTCDGCPAFLTPVAVGIRLTFCTYRRASLLVDPGLVEILTIQILRAGDLACFAVPAYCFMPDHVHLLVEGRCQHSALPRFLKLAKQLSGFYGRQAIGRPLRQAGCYERLLRLDEDPRRVVAYIIFNPVRRNLVSRPDDYAFIGSGVFSRQELLAYARLQGVQRIRTVLRRPSGRACSGSARPCATTTPRSSP